MYVYLYVLASWREHQRNERFSLTACLWHILPLYDIVWCSLRGLVGAVFEILQVQQGGWCVGVRNTAILESIYWYYSIRMAIAMGLT